MVEAVVGQEGVPGAGVGEVFAVDGDGVGTGAEESPPVADGAVDDQLVPHVC